MLDAWLLILLHQFLFQGMFVIKNLLLKKKTGKQIRGKNWEATVSIGFFSGFIVLSLYFSLMIDAPGTIMFGGLQQAQFFGIFFLLASLLVSYLSLANMKDSWRVGVLEDQQTDLVLAGIYQYSRNPYFVSYLLMFTAYTLLLQNVILLVLSIVGFVFIHKMILKEEAYLSTVHGQAYSQYKKTTPRYIFF